MAKKFYLTEYKEGICIKNKPAEKKDIKAALSFKKRLDTLNKKLSELKEEIKIMQGSCDHKVKIDEEGFAYTPRICVACGAVWFI